MPPSTAKPRSNRSPLIRSACKQRDGVGAAAGQENHRPAAQCARDVGDRAIDQRSGCRKAAKFDGLAGVGGQHLQCGLILARFLSGLRSVCSMCGNPRGIPQQ